MALGYTSHPLSIFTHHFALCRLGLFYLPHYLPSHSLGNGQDFIQIPPTAKNKNCKNTSVYIHAWISVYCL